MIKTLKGRSAKSNQPKQPYRLRLVPYRSVAGRYQLKEAAAKIAQAEIENVADLLAKLKSAVRDGVLPAYKPDQIQRLDHRQLQTEVRDNFEEVYWDELNAWLEKYEPRLKFRFTKPMPLPEWSPDDDQDEEFFEDGNSKHGVMDRPATAPVQAAESDEPDLRRYPWVPQARKIAEEIAIKKPQLNLERISEAVHEEMTRQQQLGEPGMTGRGDRVPRPDTIRRWAFKRLKNNIK